MGGLYRVFALRYGTRELADEALFLQSARTCARIDYFIWVAIEEGSGHAVVVDTGFRDDAQAAARGRQTLASPPTLLRDALGVDPGTVDTLILTHLHDDHTGHVRDLPAARVYLQGEDLRFWTGPVASRPLFRDLLDLDDLTHLIRLNAAGRLRLLEGSETVADGVRVHRVGGHTPGLQVVTVRTAAGTVVLAGDALHYRVELEEDLIFKLVTDVAQSYRALDVIAGLTERRELIVPGHDPEVMDRYPRHPGSDLVVRIA